MSSNKKGRDFATSPLVSNNCRTGEHSTSQIYKNYVPLDYMKAEIIDFNAKDLLNNDLLIFASPINEFTGKKRDDYNRHGEKRKPCRIATYKNLVFRYYPDSGYLTLSGSLHTFYNDGVNNANDFDETAFKTVLERLKSFFNLLPQQLKIIQLEWGVNLLLENVNQIIKHCLFYKTVKFTTVFDGRKGNYKRAKLDEFALKAYNKGLHFNIGYDILRFERHQSNWAKYCKHKKIGRTLFDLIESDYKHLRKTLTDNWNEILFFDPFIPESETKIIKFRDPIFWEKKRKTLTNAGVKKNRDKLRLANVEKGGDLQGKVADAIELKLNSLNNEKLTNPDFIYDENTLTPIINKHYINLNSWRA